MASLPDPETYICEPTLSVPNSHLPALVYRDVLPRPHSAVSATQVLESNHWKKGGEWGAVPRHHFHPNTHECYAVFQGSSNLLLGVGPLDPESRGIKIRVQSGDVIVIPAGVAHCSQTSHDYQYIGAYPNVSFDRVTGQALLEPAANAFIKGFPKWRNEYGRDVSKVASLSEEASKVPIPEWDPVRGQGYLDQFWR